MKVRSLLDHVVLCLAFALCTPSGAAPAIWYEDNNLGKAAGTPADFLDKFRRPETFSRATSHIQVYMIRANVLNQLDDEFLVTLFSPYLRKNGIRLAINAGGATWAQAPGRAKTFEMNMRVLRRLKALGLDVHFISLQSVLSKQLVRAGKRIDYPLEKRIQDVVAYAAAAREIFPEAELGIIDALPAHGRDYRLPYRRLRDALREAGLRLSYVHVDAPFEYPAERRNGVSWQSLREVERFVEEELGLQFGLLATSRKGGMNSSRAFHDRVLAALECYAGASGTPRDFVIASWFPHPRLTVPDTAEGKEYPAMHTVLKFGERLDELERSGLTGAGSRVRDPAWRALCTER